MKKPFGLVGLVGLVGFAFVSTLTGTALADVPPPNTSSCTTKKVNDSCALDDGSAGQCAASKCSRINYACDGGQSPCGSVETDCLKCQAGSATAPSGSVGGGGCATSGATPSGLGTRLGALLTLGLVGAGLLRRRRGNVAR